MVRCESEELTDTGRQCYISALAARYTFYLTWQRAIRAASQIVPVFEDLEVIPWGRTLRCQLASSCRRIVDMIVVASRLRVPRAMLLESPIAWP